MATAAAAKQYATYRLFDADGALLYVGCSAEPEKRVLDHRRQSWGAEISRVTFGAHATREAAALEEYEAMLNEHPRYNRRRVLDRRTDRSWRRRGPQWPTAAYRLANAFLDGKVDDFILSRRAARRSWRLIARDLYEVTGGEVDVADATVRAWVEHIEAAS